MKLHVRMNLALPLPSFACSTHTAVLGPGRAGSERFSVGGHPLGGLSWTRGFACPPPLTAPTPRMSPAGIASLIQCGPAAAYWTASRGRV